MRLTQTERETLRSIWQGVNNTDTFLADLTNYHGDALKTEYILTSDIARAFLVFVDVGVEFLASTVKNHFLRERPFRLGNKRFDIVIFRADRLPVVIVEVKINIASLNDRLRIDLNKIIRFLRCMNLNYASSVLGVVVFQTHVRAHSRNSVPITTARILGTENKIKASLKKFASNNLDFEFQWYQFQNRLGRIYPDEVFEDPLEGPTLGAFGHATRYHAILLRRKA